MHPEEQHFVIEEQWQRLLADRAQKVSAASFQFIQQFFAIANMGSKGPYNSEYLSENYFNSLFKACFKYPK